MAANTIDVGCVRNERRDVFIAVPVSLYEDICSCLTHSKKPSIRIPRKDLRWLIEALEKEEATDATDAE